MLNGALRALVKEFKLEIFLSGRTKNYTTYDLCYVFL